MQVLCSRCILDKQCTLRRPLNIPVRKWRPRNTYLQLRIGPDEA